MRKTLILLLVGGVMNSINAQQFEWVKTYVNNLANNGVTNNNLCNINAFGDDVIITGYACGKYIDLDPGAGQNLYYPAGYKATDVFVTILGKNGIAKSSTMIYTPSGGDAPTSVVNKMASNLISFGLTTSSDSIKFTNAGAWNRLKRKDKFSASNAFLLNFDTLLNFKNAIPFYSYKNVGISDIVIDAAGNKYITGYFMDSLTINRKLRLVSKTSTTFFLKMDSKDSIVWLNHTNMLLTGESRSRMSYNAMRNSVYMLFFLSNNKKGIYYVQQDSVVLPSSALMQYALSEIDAGNGKLLQSNVFTASNLGFAPIDFKANDSFILITGYGKNSDITIGTEIYKLTTTKNGDGGQFLSCFGTTKLNHKYTNVYDSCGGNLTISNIFNDSLFYLLGESIGNQKFDFRGNTVKASDYLSKSRVATYAYTDFFAQYSVSNRLKDVWFMQPNNPVQSITYSSSGRILNNNGEIYIVGNISYLKELALGKRSFKYATNSFADISVVKYNCRPTAYFNYTLSGKQASFKNLSSNSNAYLWEFGVNGATANTKNSIYSFPTKGATYYPQLIASNNCGKDTFQQAVLIDNSSILAVSLKGFSISPNPANSQVSIILEEGIYILNIASIEVFDIKGRKVNCEIVNATDNTYNLNVSSLASGLYTISVLSPSGKFTSKVIVN